MEEIETMKQIYETMPGWKKTQFDVTPNMSTYILAFVVKYVYTVGPNGLKIRVDGCLDDYINNTDYAIKIIPKAFQFFEDYFNITEVIKKSGMI